MSAFREVLLFKPKYRLGHPENHLFLLSKKYFPDQSIQKLLILILKTDALILSPFVFENKLLCELKVRVGTPLSAVLLISKLHKMFFGYFDPDFFQDK